MKKYFFLIFLIALFIFINYTQKEKLFYSFYHWESNYKEKDIKEKLYIKVLDINYSNKIDLIKTSFITKPSKNYIPVIYITNNTIKNNDYKILSNLIINQLKHLNIGFKELQIDCDWSLSTKSNYFNLLKELKTKLNKTISATIRLHQVKYFSKTGIPPVDYGVLMYYNMSSISNINTKNSILDNEVAKKYHYNFDDYSLKLKLALPLYSQAIQFRHDKALDIFEGVALLDFKENFKKISKNKYEVINSTYFKGRYIYKGDIFRFEDSNYEDIKIALKDFLKLTKNRFNEVIFYTFKYKEKYNLDDLIK